MYDSTFNLDELKEGVKKRKSGDQLTPELGMFEIPPELEIPFPLPKDTIESEDWEHPESIAIWNKRQKKGDVVYSKGEFQKCERCGFIHCQCRSKITFKQKLKNHFHIIKKRIENILKSLKLRFNGKALLEDLQLQRFDLSQEGILEKHYYYMTKKRYEEHLDYTEKSLPFLLDEPNLLDYYTYQADKHYKLFNDFLEKATALDKKITSSKYNNYQKPRVGGY